MSRTTQESARLGKGFVYRIVTFCDWPFQTILLPLLLATTQSYNPNVAETALVWASPLSLATTYGITFVFFSYGYLDVSVPRVCSLHSSVTESSSAGLPHSEIYGSRDICSSP